MNAIKSAVKRFTFTMLIELTGLASPNIEMMPECPERLYDWSNASVDLICDGPKTNLTLSGCATLDAAVLGIRLMLQKKGLTLETTSLSGDTPTNLPYIVVSIGKTRHCIPVETDVHPSIFKRSGMWEFVDLFGNKHSGDIDWYFRDDLTNLIPLEVSNRSGFLIVQTEDQFDHRRLTGEMRWGTVTNGVRDGIWCCRMRDDSWATRSLFRAGILHGISHMWSANFGGSKKTIYRTGWYENGEASGCWYTVDVHGQLVEVASMQKGRLNGGSVIFDASDGLIRGITVSLLSKTAAILPGDLLIC